MKKLKDHEHTETIIKISKIREVYSPKKGCYSFGDKMFCVKIKKSTYNTYEAFPCTKQGKKELLNFIKKECYL